MALTDAQWAAVQVDVNVRLIAGTITEAQAVAELAAATEDWPTRSLSNADLALRVSKVLANLGGLIETEGPPSMDVGAPGATAFDSVNIAFYGPKTVESWGAPRSLLGNPGPAIELRVSGGFVQWRVVGAATWINLIALADLKGADGQQVELRTNSTHVQWRLGAGTWTDLIALSALKGADGREIELQKSATHIQWRYVGDAGWTDLIPLADLKVTGDAGSNGWTQVEAIAADGERRVKRIIDWIGGTGTKPATGKYVGPAGLVDTAAEATDVRGPGGSGSGDMQGANNLSDLTDDAAARTNLVVYSKGEVDDFLDGKQASLGFTPEDAAEKGAANGYAGLDAGGKVPAAQLPDPPTVPVKATGAELRTGTDDAKFGTAKGMADAVAVVTITPTTAAAGMDFSGFINAEITLTANLTVGAPSGGFARKTGEIDIVQDATGGRTLAFHANYIVPANFALQATANGRTSIPYRYQADGKVRLYNPSKWVA